MRPLSRSTVRSAGCARRPVSTPYWCGISRFSTAKVPIQRQWFCIGSPRNTVSTTSSDMLWVSVGLRGRSSVNAVFLVDSDYYSTALARSGVGVRRDRTDRPPPNGGFRSSKSGPTAPILSWWGAGGPSENCVVSSKLLQPSTAPSPIQLQRPAAYLNGIEAPRGD